MRVVHAISGIDPLQGGTATALTALAAAQQKAGLDVSVVSTYVGEPAAAAAKELRDQGVKVTEVGPCTLPLQRHPDLKQTLQDAIVKADVLHIHALWEEIQHRAARVAQSLGKPYLATPHGMLDPWSLRQSALKKKIYMALRLRRNLDRASAIHYTSAIEREVCAPLRLRPPAIVVPNGVDLAEFVDLPPRGAFRAKYPQLQDRPIVLFLGRVHPKKGFDLLIPAFARAELGAAMLVVVGPAHEGYGEVVKELAAREKIADRLLMVGMLRGRDRIEAIVDADLFVLPSYQENFGIAVAEALVAGCPVVISDQVNIHKEVAAAGVGAVVRTQIDPLAAELKRWMGDAALRRQAGKRGPDFVRRNFDWNNIALKWIEQYSKLQRGLN